MKQKLKNKLRLAFKKRNSGQIIKSGLLTAFLLTSVILILLLGSYGEDNGVYGATTELSGLPEDGKFNYVTLADVNKDNYLDIVVGAGGYPGEEPGGLYVYLNQNGNSFSDGSTGLPGPGKTYCGSVQVIDIDKDSNLDIVASFETHWSKGKTEGIGIWLGNGGSGGAMKWTEADSPAITGSYDSANCADIDNDGNLDLVGGSSNGIFAWKGSHSKGSLSWSKVSDGLPNSDEFTGVTLGDVNNDDRLDIVAGSYNSRGISIYLCSGSGSISWSDGHSDTDLKTKGNSFEMYLVDLNKDSNLDIVSSIRGGIKVYLGNGNSGSKETWWTEVSSGLPTSGDYYQVAVADIDKDDKLDIGSKYRIWSNAGAMNDISSFSWEKMDIGIPESDSIGFTIGDLDNDGQLDIVGCGWGSGVKAFTLSLEAKYYKIIGKVKNHKNNSPIAGATVSTDKGGYSTKTTSDGSFNLEVIEGTYEITVSYDGYREAKKIGIVSGGDLTLNINLVETSDIPDMKYRISGTLTDSGSGHPLSQVTIKLEPGGYSTTTDNDGKYSIEATNGSYILSYSKPEYNIESLNIEINGKNIIKDFALSPTSINNDEDDNRDDDSKSGGLPFLEAPLFIFSLLIAILITHRLFKGRIK